MKKIIFLVLFAGTLVFSSAIFAQTGPQEIVIQSVTGTVGYEAAPGKWETVTTDKKLTPSTVINTGLNSSLVLNIGGKTVTIKAMQRGTVAKLSAAASSGATGLKLGAAATGSSVNTAAGQARSNISTASTRASDAVEDLEWAEEEEETEKTE